MSLKVEKSDPHNPCCSEKVKNGIYGTTVTLVALAVIFGALVLITQHFGINWGHLNGPMQQFIELLGKYTFVPLAATSGLLALLLVVGIVWKCPSHQPPSKEEELNPPPATTFRMKEPVPAVNAQTPKKTEGKPQKTGGRDPQPKGQDSKGKSPALDFPRGQGKAWGQGKIDLADPRWGKDTGTENSDEDNVKGFPLKPHHVKNVLGTKTYSMPTARKDRVRDSGGSSGSKLGFLSILRGDISDSD